jgi:hypothetical protein
MALRLKFSIMARVAPTTAIQGRFQFPSSSP